MKIPRLSWKYGAIAPVLLGATLWVCPEAIGYANTPRAIATDATSEVQATQPQTDEQKATNTLQDTETPLQAELKESTVAEEETPVSQLQIQDEPAMPPAIAEPAPVAEVPVNASDASLLEQINSYSNKNADAFDQVNNVSQLSDVSPNDWAYEALRSLVERYGCIAGYPDGTFRGNRAMTRYEFAAGLNACLQQIERLITSSSEGFVTRQDLETLQRLVQEFQTELTALGTRVDNLERRAAVLENNRFSTTTKLEGEAIFGLASVVTGENEGEDIEENPVLGHRTRLELNTSFTGEDLLFTRLSAGNFPEFADVTGTREGELAFAQPDNNDVGLEVLFYRFPLGENTQVLIAAAGGAADDFASTVNFLDGDGGSGALSAFGTRNPIYYLVEDGAGLAVTTELGSAFELSLGYLAREADDPSEGNGLFEGAYGALAQLLFKPSDRFNIAFTYVNAYDADDTGTGSSRSTFSQFDDAFFQDLDLLPQNVPTSSNAYGIEVSWQLSDKFVVGGWVGYANTRLLSSAGGLINRGSLDVWNYAVTLAFPDLGKEGNLAGIIFGMEPKVTDSTVTYPAATLAQFAAAGIDPPDLSEDDDTSFHIEAFYQYQVNENISITPGVIWITAPGFNNDNDDLVIGAIRTTFSF